MPSQWLAGIDTLHEFPFLHDQDTAHQHVFNAYTRIHRMLIGRAVTHCQRVENDNVRIRAFLQTALEPGGRSRALEHLSRHERHFSDGIHERERSLAAHVAREDTAERSGIARVAFIPVARDHHQRVSQNRVNRLHGVAEQNDQVRFAGFVEFFKSLPGKPLSGLRQHKIAVSYPELLLPAAVEQGGVDFKQGDTVTPSSIGSYEAIRVYLWAGMLDPATPEREDLLKALSGMAKCLRSTAVPPAKIKQDGTIEDPNGPVGFSAALLPYLCALGETALRDQQMDRVRSQFDSKTGLYGSPAKYYDQNLLLFALGSTERRFRFDSQGRLKTSWKHD
jgi:hypothetical protein